MVFSPKTRGVLFITAAVLISVAAVYHIAALFCKIDQSPIWRHLLFICINLFCVFGFLKRPAYFTWFVAALLVQQYYSHGSYLIHLWIEKKQIHWISVFDLLLLPVAFICLLDDRKAKAIKKIL